MSLDGVCERFFVALERGIGGSAAVGGSAAGRRGTGKDIILQQVSRLNVVQVAQTSTSRSNMQCHHMQRRAFAGCFCSSILVLLYSSRVTRWGNGVVDTTKLPVADRDARTRWLLVQMAGRVAFFEVKVRLL